jgi:hypothetical protein
MPSAVAGGFNDTAVVLGDLGVNQFPAVALQAVEGALFVCAHEPTVASHVSGEDSGEATSGGAPRPHRQDHGRWHAR